MSFGLISVRYPTIPRISTGTFSFLNLKKVFIVGILKVTLP